MLGQFFGPKNPIELPPRVAEFLQSLMDITGTTLEDIHAIGSSLGGQMMGGVGLTMGGKMKRITALDPAGKLILGAKRSIIN